CEDHCVGVQWAQTAEAGPGEIEVEGGPGQLGGDQDADKHPDDTPHHRHDGELADHLVVVGGTGCCVHVWASIHGFGQSAASAIAWRSGIDGFCSGVKDGETLLPAY